MRELHNVLQGLQRAGDRQARGQVVHALQAGQGLLVVVPLLHFGVVAAMCLLVLALKWLLLGRVRPGQHPLWSCWVSRWDFLYVAWDFYARSALIALEGTLLLNWYLQLHYIPWRDVHY